MDRHPDIVLILMNQHNEDRDVEHRNSVYQVGKIDKTETVQAETEGDEDDDDE